MLVPFVSLHLLTSPSKKRFVSIGRKGLYHTTATGAVAFIAMIIFNPFHLTNLTHTFVISVSKHAERWRDIYEWKSAFDWTNKVGTGFPFLVMYVLSIGLLVLWLFSRFLKPALLKAPSNELEVQKRRFVRLLTLFGYGTFVLICLAIFLSLSLLSLDGTGFLLCAVFTAILMLSIFKNVHFIYLTIPLALLAVWSGDAATGYNGRYFYPFVIVPMYVILHIPASLLSEKVHNKPLNILFVTLAAVTSLLLMVVLFNPFGFKMPVWHLRQFLYVHRIWHPEYEQNIESSYTHLFSVLYSINIISIVCWVGFTYLRKFIRKSQTESESKLAPGAFQLPKIDIALITISALTIYMAVRSRRFIPIAAIAACPVMAMFIDQMLQTFSASRNFHIRQRLAVSLMPRNTQVFIGAFGVVAVLFFGITWGLKFKRVYLDPWPSDPKLSSVFMRMTASDAKPFCATKFIKDNKLEGKMFNYWTEGGFIAWGQEPDPNTGRTPLQLFMDGRAQAAYDRKDFDCWTYIMSGGLPGSVGYDIIQSAQARAMTMGKTLEQMLTPDDYEKIGQSISQELENRNIWVVLMPAAVYRDSDRSSSYQAFKAFETNPNWRLVFFNDRQKLYVDIRTQRGKELFEGIFDGKTIYPDDYHRNLVQAHNWLLYRRKMAQRKKGLEFAFKAFNLNPSPASMLEIFAFGNFRELNSSVNKFCQDYFDIFKKNKVNWTDQDGYRLKVEAARMASIYLKQLAQKRRNLKLMSLYASKENQYLSELGVVSQDMRW